MRALVPTAELREALQRIVPEALGRPCTIAGFSRRPSDRRTSFGLEELDVGLEDGAELRLVFKDLGWASLDERGRIAKPRILYDPLREIETYRGLLAPTSLGTPRYYGSVSDSERGRYWLFIERVEGAELYQVEEIERWADAARWLASLHSRFAGARRREGDQAPLVAHDAPYYRMWIERAVRFAREGGGARHEVDFLARLASRHDEVVERLLALPVTFIHGEFYASNILIAPGGRVCPVDWEVAGVGPGLIDLAALRTGWDVPSQAILEGAYQAAWPEPGFALDAGALDLCQLHLAVRWLGWAPRAWRPPREHRRDWLADAVGLVEKLGV